jgi:hypothetical protein
MKKRFTLYYYQSMTTGLWYWRMLGPSKKMIFDGAQSYKTKTLLLSAVRRMKALDFDYILIKTDGLDEPKEDLILR